MPKSKELVTSSESGGSDADEPKKKKTKQVEKKPVANKREHKKVSGGAGGSSRDDEEKKYEIGKMRFIGVSEFRGKKLISIREYYTTDDGETRPGKKGISLSVDQWEKLKKVIKDVDADIGEVE